jgi:hypothetical protein
MVAIVIGLMTLGVATAIAGTNRIQLRADLLGANELPAADPDGRGDAEVTLKTNTNEICFALEWRRIGAPNRGHIHVGDSTVNGPVVVTFFDLVAPMPADPFNPLFDQLEKGRVRGCVPATAELIGQIAANPSGYYVNLHNARFPAGAIRGQLGTP